MSEWLKRSSEDPFTGKEYCPHCTWHVRMEEHTSEKCAELAEINRQLFSRQEVPQAFYATFEDEG